MSTTAYDMTAAPLAASSAPQIMSYTPIGFGLPISVEILTVYVGAFKKGLFAGDKKDLLCVSGVKAPETFGATPRAINLLKQAVPEKTYLEFSAFSACTPYVYYKKSVDSGTIDITIELTADSFHSDIVSTISDLMGKAAGLPIFMPASGKLLAGSTLIKTLSADANDLFAPSPILSETVTVRFNTAGIPSNKAQSMLICRDEDQQEFSSYTMEAINTFGDNTVRMVKGGIPYNGDSPYVIINLNGANRPELESWTVKLATTSVLSEFYGSDDSAADVGGALSDAMSLYNDYTYRTKADGIWQQMQNLTPGTDQYQLLQTQYQAYQNNISNPLFCENKIAQTS